MSVYIIKNFLNKNEIELIKNSQKTFFVPDERTGYMKSWRSTAEVENAIGLIRKQIEATYNLSAPNCQFAVIKMPEGSRNGIHQDTSDYSFDGEWDDEVGISALLYLSESGVDFSGGSLVFPEQEMKYEPELGSLVFFRGDWEHRHGVEKVLSGERTTLVVFF
jgi:Rps23 Pro-64 3,4-dihydroxylase Tpa1-like proline 4-hydroxylase